MQSLWFSLGILLFGVLAFANAEPEDTLYDESKVPSYVLPELLTGENGVAVQSRREWEAVRRPEVLRLFEDHVYGRTPTQQLPFRYELVETDAQALGGQATRKQVAILLGDDSPLRIDLLIYVPNQGSSPAPAFLGLNFFGNQTVHSDPAIKMNQGWMRSRPGIGVVNNRATEKTRGAYQARWQVEEVVKRGYAVATLYCGDIDPDSYNHDFSDGVHPLFYEDGQAAPLPKQWGTIGAWAWGLSRALDYLQSDEQVDGARVAVLGHSRLGKTALWAGAQDQRFKMVISNNSGCGGAALYRRCYGERIHHMVKPIGYWFCRHHLTYSKREQELPVDQHMLLALIAPRPLYVASAEQDQWADPRGEFLSAKFASPAYALYGRPALVNAEFPQLDTPLRSIVSYHYRSGEHDVTNYDWQQYLAFADDNL